MFREINSADIGKALFRIDGKAWPVSGFLGRILPGDVGKRVYVVGRAPDQILQVENDEQRERRLADSKPVAE